MSARRKPGQERSRAMVSAILDGCARVLLEDGYDRASTNRIAKAAGVSVGSLYQYFSNKEAVIAALAERHLAEEMQVLAEALATSKDAPLPETADAVIRGLFAAHQVNPALHAVLVTALPASLLATVKVRCCEQITEVMNARRDELRIEDTELAAFILVEMVDSSLQAATVERQEYLADDRLIEALVEVTLRFIQRD